VLEEIDVSYGSSPNSVTIDGEDGLFETIEAYVVVIDENFTDDDDDQDLEEDADDADGGDDE
jgi:small subunit ribosomal protein S4e